MSVARSAVPYDCAVPFTLRNLKEDLEDVGSRFDGAPDLEFRLATEALELERSCLGYQRVPPGYRFPYGHTHEKQEEVYVVVRGSGRMKVDDEIVDLREWDAVRVPPGTWRGYEAGPEGLEILVIGAPNLGEAPREDLNLRAPLLDAPRPLLELGLRVVAAAPASAEVEAHERPVGGHLVGLER